MLKTWVTVRESSFSSFSSSTVPSVASIKRDEMGKIEKSVLGNYDFWKRKKTKRKKVGMSHKILKRS